MAPDQYRLDYRTAAPQTRCPLYPTRRFQFAIPECDFGDIGRSLERERRALVGATGTWPVTNQSCGTNLVVRWNV
jgi:hypothetical protein